MVYKILFIVIVTTALLIAGIYSSVNAQSSATNNNISNNQNSTLGSTTITKKSYGLRISSPVAGDQVLISGNNYYNKNGQNFTIQGFSVFDANASLNCYVSVIANGIKPYQIANGTGPKGNHDFTTWKYTFSPLYASLKEGPNKITSKLSCQPGNIAAFYSVNINGSKFNGTFPNSIQQSPISSKTKLSNTSSISSNNSGLTASTIAQTNQSPSTPPTPPTIAQTNQSPSTPPTPPTIAQTNQSPSTPPTPPTIAQTNQSPSTPPTPPTIAQTNQSPSTPPTPPTIAQTLVPNSSSSISSNNSSLTSISPLPTTNNETTNNTSITKSMNIAIEKIDNAKTESLVIMLKDSATAQPIEGAYLTGNLNGESFSGITNSNGEFIKVISSTALKSSSTLHVTLTASADGYKPNKANATLDTSSKSKSTTTTSSSNGNINNGAKDMASRIAKDVQKQLSKQGINIPLPFGG